MSRSLQFWMLLLLLAFLPISYFFIDKPLAIAIYHGELTSLWPALNVISLLGKSEIYLFLFLALGLYFRYVQEKPLYERRAWYLLGCVALPFFLGLVLKVVLGRARPELLFSQQIFGFYGLQWTQAYWSCPSGHALTATALLYGLSRLSFRWRYVFLLVALLVMATRLLLLRHYLSDVVFGACLAFVSVAWWTMRYLDPDEIS
jgi:membrane-associated phospholipid phosphatase